MNVNNELFFPPELIPKLADLRDGDWRKFVEKIAMIPETHADTLAFMMLIVQLGGCLSCGPGSFRHMKGCLSCSRQAIGSFKGSHAELMAMFEEAREEVVRFLASSDNKKKECIAA